MREFVVIFMHGLGNVLYQLFGLEIKMMVRIVAERKR